MQASVDSARKEEQVREREGAKKAKKMQKGNEGRGNNGSGKTSPVPMEDAAAKVTKDDDKENQRKGRGKKENVKQSVEPVHVSEAAATNVFSKTQEN